MDLRFGYERRGRPVASDLEDRGKSGAGAVPHCCCVVDLVDRNGRSYRFVY